MTDVGINFTTKHAGFKSSQRQPAQNRVSLLYDHFFTRYLDIFYQPAVDKPAASQYIMAKQKISSGAGRCFSSAQLHEPVIHKVFP